MSPSVEGGATAPPPAVLAWGIEALGNAAAWLEEASRRIQAESEGSKAVELFAEETRDVLARVKAEREKLAATSSGAS